MILIGICCDAGPDAAGKERKITIIINVDGEVQEVRIGWPGPKDESICEGPVLRITPEEYLSQLEMSGRKKET